MPEHIHQLILLMIPLPPLVAAVALALLGKTTFRERSHVVCCAALWVSFACSLAVLFWSLPQRLGSDPAALITAGYDWISVGPIHVRLDLKADAMTAIMLAMVTGVSLLIAIFSSSYMQGDAGYIRFFAAVSLFVFSMCMLVLASNLLVLYLFWEGVGLCSYLLIGFWFQKPSAAAAAKKAFVINRIGDFGFLLAIFFIWQTFGTLDFAELFDAEKLAAIAAAQPERITLICGLLLLGAAGKSAQFPLHIWLPDAMEGPTPVSALIHAATMVTAGVYLVARCTPLFELAPSIQVTMAVIGAATALIAALTALTQYDLKRVLAYSTVSQLGFMFMALGAGVGSKELMSMAVTAAMFHLFTHAFFKALLFLAAGSVMHSMGDVIDMRRFGGLRKVLPVTHWTFLCGAAALAGVPLLSGFWSKDEILVVLSEASHHEHYGSILRAVFWVAAGTALLTAFYTFRAYFLTFWGKEKFPQEAGHHPHEAPPKMAWPLRILALFALAVGLIVGPTHGFAGYLAHTVGIEPVESHGWHWGMMALSTGLALMGIAAAMALYKQASGIPEKLATGLQPLHQLSLNRFFLDEIFEGLVVAPLQGLGSLVRSMDARLIAPIVAGVGQLPRLLGLIPRPFHSGLVSTYALVMWLGVIAGALIMLGLF